MSITASDGRWYAVTASRADNGTISLTWHRVAVWRLIDDGEIVGAFQRGGVAGPGLTWFRDAHNYRAGKGTRTLFVGYFTNDDRAPSETVEMYERARAVWRDFDERIASESP